MSQVNSAQVQKSSEKPNSIAKLESFEVNFLSNSKPELWTSQNLKKLNSNPNIFGSIFMWKMFNTRISHNTVLHMVLLVLDARDWGTMGLDSQQICNLGRSHYLPQRLKSMVFFLKRFKWSCHEGTCGVKNFFPKKCWF